MSKTTKIETKVAALELFCPVTGGAIPGPYSGSHIWSREDCEDAMEAGRVQCTECEGSHAVPAAAKAMAKR